MKCPRCGEDEHPDQCTAVPFRDGAKPQAETERAAALCEQIAVNLRANAISTESILLRRELEGCAGTADQCALSIRKGRIVTQFDKNI